MFFFSQPGESERGGQSPISPEANKKLAARKCTTKPNLGIVGAFQEEVEDEQEEENAGNKDKTGGSRTPSPTLLLL
jgi:hypothetical protein